jgi:alpha-glucosidase
VTRAWWRSAVFYQVYPRSFADGNGDGIGDLIGLRERLDHLVALGVDALWLSPFYRSPMTDGGYDVADPCDVDPIFGTLDDFDDLMKAVHDRGLRMTIDMVPNHVSDQHAWFRAALASPPGSVERARFIFRDGHGTRGELPPNNWPSMFGGPAWTRVPDTEAETDAGDLRREGNTAAGGQWYLHIFAAEQPDLNWANPEVPTEFERIMRFWLDRGVDGFRIDVAHGMAKPAGLPPMDLSDWDGRPGAKLVDDVRWDQDHVHDYLRGFRRVLDSYSGDRMAVGEAWVSDDSRLSRYVRPDELNLTFNFRLLETPWGAEAFRASISDSIRAMQGVGAPCTWVLSNHDVERHVTRYGGGSVGLARARAAALIQLSLPGAAYIYNGDELSLPNVDLPDSALQDPTWERSGHTDRGRDGERVPLPWSGTEPPFGFGSGRTSWLPIPAHWAELTVEAEEADPASTLSLYRQLLAARRGLADLHGAAFAWLDAPAGCLAYRRGASLTVLLNAGDHDVVLPAGAILLASGPLGNGVLPGNSAVWQRS